MNINELYPSKYFKATDFDTSQHFTISSVSVEPVGAEQENKPVLYFNGDARGVVLNKTNASVVAHAYGDETERWSGKPVECRSEPVQFGGRIVDAIRLYIPVAPPGAPSTGIDF